MPSIELAVIITLLILQCCLVGYVISLFKGILPATHKVYRRRKGKEGNEK